MQESMATPSVTTLFPKIPVVCKPTLGCLYLLWGEGTHSFKIGFTRVSVHARASTIQAFSPAPLRIEGVIAGTLRDEKRLHRQFHAYHSHGEWFSFPEPVAWQVLALFGRTP